MKNILLTLLLILSMQIFAQEEKREFGKIPQSEIELAFYAKDKEADAVVLFDIGESKFFDTDNGYDIRFTRHKRIKIFGKSALKYAEISIPFYVDGNGKTEVVKSIEAYTYNYVNGRLKKQQLNPSTIYEEQRSKNWKIKKFVFPNVQEGSIIEYKYVLETPFHFNLPDWYFQDKIPTIYSEYVVRMVPFYEYKFIVQGISKFDYQNSVVDDENRKWGNISKSMGQNVGSGFEFQDYIHTYVLKDIPAFKDESYISSVNDYIIKMDFQLARFHSPRGGSLEIISTWPKLNKSLLKHEKFGKYKKSCLRYAKRILEDELNITELKKLAQSKKIIDYVKSNFTWNQYNSKYASQSAKEFIKKKTGNSADINLFLLAMFEAAEIESQAVILSTRNHGKIQLNYPFDHFTNYVIVLVNTGSSFLVDATESLLPFNRLPNRCFNGSGIIVSKDNEEKWVTLTNTILSFEKNTIAIEIDTNSCVAMVNVTIQCTEYDAYNYRNEYENDTSSIKEFFSDNIDNIQRIKTVNYKNVSKPYYIAFQGTDEIEKFGDNFVVNPFLSLALTKNNLTQKKRTYPVDLVYASNHVFDVSLTIPKGYQLARLPESYAMDNALAEIKVNYSLEETTLKITGNYLFKKPVYVAIEYARIKYYIDTIIKKFNEEIVLEKIVNNQ